MHNPPRIDDLLERLIKKEGGAVNDPLDLGGATKYGVTRPALAEYLGVDTSVITREMIFALTLDEAKKVYMKKWIQHPTLRIDLLEDHDIAEIMLDTAVLFSRQRAAKWLQEICGVQQDGSIGPQTRAALRLIDPRAVVYHLARARILRHARRVQENPTQVRFLRGWLDRALEFLAPEGA